MKLIVYQFGNKHRKKNYSNQSQSGTPLQYSCLENPMDGGPWQAAVHGVTKSRTQLSNLTLTFTFMHWRRKWQPTSVFLPGESQGRGSLVGCRLWGHMESDTTEATQQQQQQPIRSLPQYILRTKILKWQTNLKIPNVLCSFIVNSNKYIIILKLTCIYF